MSDTLPTVAGFAIPLREGAGRRVPKTIDHLQKHSIEATRRWQRLQLRRVVRPLHQVMHLPGRASRRDVRLDRKRPNIALSVWAPVDN